MKDKPNEQASKDRSNSKEPLKDLSEMKKLKSLDTISSDGFVCDIETGVCGPVTKEKGDKK